MTCILKQRKFYSLARFKCKIRKFIFFNSEANENLMAKFLKHLIFDKLNKNAKALDLKVYKICQELMNLLIYVNFTEN